MKTMKSIMLVLLIMLVTSCATIPQKSVSVSREIGIGIKKQHQAQIDLVNLHFDIKRKELDQAMLRALQKYFQILLPAGTITLNKNQLADVASDVMDLNEKNNAAKEELEKARVLLIAEIEDNYLALNQANSSITRLLQSAVTIKGARSEAFESVSAASGGKLDLDKVFAEVDEFVLKGGQEAGKTINLIDNLKTLFDKSDN
jgi:hypothetical protein